jgi:hypothetical protein
MPTARPAPGKWEFSFGPALRQGGSVEFSRQTLRRPDGGQYVNGRHADGRNFLIEGDPADQGSAAENVSPQLDVIGWQTVDPNGVPGSGDETYFRNVTFDRAVLKGADADLDGGWALSAGASRTLGRNPLRASRLTLGLDIYHGEATASVSTGQGISITTLTGILYQNGGTNPGTSRPVTPYEENDGSVTQGGPGNYQMTDELFSLGGARTTNVTVDLEAEVYAAAFSVGLQYDVPLTQWFTVSAGLGPALHLVLADSTLEQQAVWDAPASPLDGRRVPNFGGSQTDSEFAFCPGLFLVVGARAQLTRDLALQLGLRYDHVLTSVETDHAEFDLSGFGADARLVFSF